MEVNKSSNLLLIAAIIAVIASLVATGFTYLSIVNLASRISGYASSGEVNVSVESSVVVNFTTGSINFGSGKVAAGSVSGSLLTVGSGTITGGNWTAVSGLILENIGNRNVSLNITVGKNVSGFIGGTSPAYEINVSCGEANCCQNLTQTGIVGMTFTPGIFYNANTSNKIMYCNVFYFNSNKDQLRIDFNLTIPEDSLTGLLSDTITATATAI